MLKLFKINGKYNKLFLLSLPLSKLLLLLLLLLFLLLLFLLFLKCCNQDKGNCNHSYPDLEDIPNTMSLEPHQSQVARLQSSETLTIFEFRISSCLQLHPVRRIERHGRVEKARLLTHPTGQFIWM